MKHHCWWFSSYTVTGHCSSETKLAPHQRPVLSHPAQQTHQHQREIRAIKKFGCICKIFTAAKTANTITRCEIPRTHTNPGGQFFTTALWSCVSETTYLST